MRNKKILPINAHLKYIEYLLHLFDSEDGSITLGEIRGMFFDKFHHNDLLLNQYFGLIRLITVIFIYDEKINNQTNSEDEDYEKIKIIRHAIAHNDFEMDKNGYTFKNKRASGAKLKELKISYKDIVSWLHKIENNFYNTLKKE